MVSTKIKEATHEAHQQLEKVVVLQLKSIRNQSDYSQVLKNFYVYFSKVEQAIAPYITAKELPDLEDRRNSQYLRKDIEELGGDLSSLPAAIAPDINSLEEAFGALYVLEGSIMGGPYIVQMLQKYGMTKGFHFFSGYGENSKVMWSSFINVIDQLACTDQQKLDMINASIKTFKLFEAVFQQEYSK